MSPTSSWIRRTALQWCHLNKLRGWDKERERESFREFEFESRRRGTRKTPGLFPQKHRIWRKTCSLENLIGYIYIHTVKCQTILSPNSHCASIHNGFDPWWYWYHCWLSSAFCCASQHFDWSSHVLSDSRKKI